jgi:lysophospholipase L1-like esterase
MTTNDIPKHFAVRLFYCSPVHLFKRIILPLSLLIILITIKVFPAFAQTPDRVPDPDPNRFPQEIAAFENWDARNSTPGNAILFVGSSSIRLWKTAEAFPAYPVINRGFGGSHIPDMIYHYDRVIGRHDPALIVFYSGENDVASGVPLDQVLDDYTLLAGRILDDFPDAELLYISIKPSNSRIQHSANFSAFNRMVEDFNRGDIRLHYIDLATVLTSDGMSPDDSFFLPDRLHLNESGYKAWNRLLGPVMEQLYTTKKMDQSDP